MGIIQGMKVLDLFSGIGGFSLGLERAGMETIAFCEIEKYPRKVLAKHWPDIPIASDIRKLTYKDGVLFDDGEEIYRGTIDLVCGGFPCQDLSTAGRQKGIKADRSGLFYEMCRVISEVRPDYAIFENVTNLLNGGNGEWFESVLWEISSLRYDAEWHCIPASSIGASHHRDRIWIILHANQDCKSSESVNDEASGVSSHLANTNKNTNSTNRGEKREATEISRECGKKRQSGMPIGAGADPEILADTNKAQCERRGLSERIHKEHANFIGSSWWETEPELDRVANGIPSQMDRLGCLGNSVVPQIPEILGRAILGTCTNTEDTV